MTKEQKIIKLAEFGGWVDIKAEVDWLPEELTGIFTFPHPTDHEKTKYYINRKPIPKYFEDLNAVQKLKKKLSFDQQTEFVTNLMRVKKDFPMTEAFFAEAEEQCEALGKTLNLWS